MKIFLSALENAMFRADGNGTKPFCLYLTSHGIKMKWNLMSFYYIAKKLDVASYIRDHSENVLIDSGAHSFQKGKKVRWKEYTESYCDFIKKYDNPKVLGYFEMDVDNVIGYDNVLKLRKILESTTNKIIPVWHKNRGIEEYKKMCQEYHDRIVAVTGFKNEDIRDEQYIMFLKYAKKYNCRVHCLGMTRKEVLDRVPFDFVDSSSWVQQGLYGRIGNRKVSKDFTTNHREIVLFENYKLGIKRQEYYHNRWYKVCKD